MVGVSTGGCIALQLAADHPELARRLVMVSSAHRLGDDGRETQRAVAKLLTKGHARRASALLLSNAARTPPARGFLAMIGRLSSRLGIGRHSEDLRILLAAEDQSDATDHFGPCESPR
jgi:pimeloyl-ACP methyl ester carboxylesterase